MKAVDLLEGREKPTEWEEWSESERLDWIASRILADDRDAQESKAHEDIKGGFYYGYSYLSKSQEERRLSKEVYWETYPWSTNWLDLKLSVGQVYSRAYADHTFSEATPLNRDAIIIDRAKIGKGIDPIKYYNGKSILGDGDAYPNEYFHWFKKLGGNND